MVLGDTINLPNLAGAEVMGFVLVLARVGGLFVLAPGFSSKMIPAQAKLIIAAAISFALMPIAMHGHVLPTAPGPLAFLIMKEVLVGLAFALPLAMLGGAHPGRRDPAGHHDRLLVRRPRSTPSPTPRTRSSRSSTRCSR